MFGALRSATICSATFGEEEMKMVGWAAMLLMVMAIHDEMAVEAVPPEMLQTQAIFNVRCAG